MNLDTIHNTQISEWHALILPAISTLRQMGGTTEDVFLKIGSELQSFYQRAKDISTLANQLVSTVSGENVNLLTSRLQQMMNDMEGYLANARTRSSESCNNLLQIQLLLDKLSEPLEGFQKMNKTLRMLSISTKIESARLGELGSGFVNLAMDVEKLSHQVNEKSAGILAHRQLLLDMIVTNLTNVQTTESAQDLKVGSILHDTTQNLQALVSANERCTRFGETVANISDEVSGSIGEVVSSMQMHDMTRQQFEHIVEALERLSGELSALNIIDDSEHIRKLVVEAGDICELQEAQLHFASTELYTAVCTIIDNLREVARKQSVIADETAAIAGTTDSTESSFVDVMSQGMMTVTAVLASCASADSNMSKTMFEVAKTINEIAMFVSDIETIGSEIDLIALNSQIKAALTGPEGAALGVLAEAIKRLSDEAVRQTDEVASTLTQIHTVTEHLLLDSENEENQLESRITTMQDELSAILHTLGDMNTDINSVLSLIKGRVETLTDDVEQATTNIEVHERTKMMADAVLEDLQQIVKVSREIEPASNAFKENLKHLENQYTMESERHIHEAIARKQSGQSAVTLHSSVKNIADESEFGDNVDLF